MARENKLDLGALVALAGGFLCLLCALYYMQQLSYSVGVYSGISVVVNTYRLNTTSALISTLAQSSTILLALHLTYVLVPFALVILAIGMLWLFTKSYPRFTAEALVFCALIYMIIVGILGFDFKFSGSYIFPAALGGGVLVLLSAAYLIFVSRTKSPAQKRAASPIMINPDTPYSNIRILSTKIMSKLSGEVKILDMHFDATALENLMQLIDKNFERYTQISVLTKGDRLGGTFLNSYKDFKTELKNKNVEFELRVLDGEEATKQHERFIMDAYAAYKIPPLNIINKKSEHIVSIKHEEALRRFDALWAEATKFENIKAKPGNLQ